RYDFHGRGNVRGLITSKRDHLGHETTIAYDRFDFLPTSVSNSAALTTEASYDYRVQQPKLITDENGNQKSFTFTPLGLMASSSVMGKVNEGLGDTSTEPGTRLVYDFAAFLDRGEPVSVRTIRRLHHTSDRDVSLPERDETIETIEYSDGFGRLLQTRTEAEEIIFGDSHFGGGVLPPKQSDMPGDTVGQSRARGA